MKKILLFVLALTIALSSCDGGGSNKTASPDAKFNIVPLLAETSWEAQYPSFGPQGKEMIVTVVIMFNSSGSYTEDWGTFGGLSEGTYTMKGNIITIIGDYLAYAGNFTVSISDDGNLLTLTSKDGQSLTFTRYFPEQKPSAQDIEQESQTQDTENNKIQSPEQVEETKTESPSKYLEDPLGNQIDISEWPEKCFIEGTKTVKAERTMNPKGLTIPDIYVSYGNGIVQSIRDDENTYTCDYAILDNVPYPYEWWNATCQLKVRCGEYDMTYYYDLYPTVGWTIGAFQKYDGAVWKFAPRY